MLLLQRNVSIFRFFSVLTILGFLPSSVSIWNFTDYAAAEPVVEQENPWAKLPWKTADAGTTVLPWDTTAPGSAKTAKISLDDPHSSPLTPADETPVRVKRDFGFPDPRTALDKAFANSVRTAKQPSGIQVASVGNLAALTAAIPAQAPADTRPSGGQEAIDALAAADASFSEADYSAAAIAYVSVIDAHPGTLEAGKADSKIMGLLKSLRNGTISRSDVLSFEQWTQTFRPLTLAGGYIVLDYMGESAIAHRTLGNIELAEHYGQRAVDLAASLLQQSPNDPLQLDIVSYYYESAKALRGEVLDQVAANLYNITEMEPRTVASYAANDALADYNANFAHNRMESLLACIRLVHEHGQPRVKALRSAETVRPWLKSRVEAQRGTALWRMGMLEDALAAYETAIAHYPTRGGQNAEDLALHIALVKEQIAFNDPVAAIENYLTFIERYPDSIFVDQALNKLGSVYLRAGDYDGALVYFEETVKRFPNTAHGKVAQAEINYIMDNLYGSAELVSRLPEPGDTSSPIRYANLCGPAALHSLLKAKGINSSLIEIARSAGTDETGTSMLGLIEAAREKGLELTGVEAGSLDDTVTPFIAYVNGGHFVLVETIDQDSVSLFDDGELKRYSREEFERTWDRKALVSFPTEAKQIQTASLSTIKGGHLPTADPQDNDGVQGTDQSGNDVPPSCPAGGGGNGNGSLPGGFSGGRPGAHGSPAAFKSYGPTTRMTWAPPATGIMINGPDTALHLQISDISAPVRGPMTLSFDRVYRNGLGFHRGEFTSTASPWRNNVGSGWTHSLNMHLRGAAAVYDEDLDEYFPPQYVVYCDPVGVARLYSLSTSSGGYDYYVAASATSSTVEAAFTLKRNSTTETWSLSMRGGLTYEFSAPAASGFARLTSITDTTGHAITLSYDGAVGTGKLTKASSPSGDSQHLSFSYSGNMITKVELKQNSIVLRKATYQYNGSNELTKALDHDDQNVVYAYATSASNTASRMITKITDKMARDTDFGWEFSNDGIANYVAKKLTITNAGGLVVTADRSMTTNQTVITGGDGTTVKAKSCLSPISGDNSRISTVWHYDSDSTYVAHTYGYHSTTRVQTYHYIGANQKSNFDYTAQKNCWSKRTPMTANPEEYYYDSGGLYPTKRTDSAGLDTLYYYDSNFLLTKTVTPWSGSNGIVYAYDSYGQVTSVTNPLGQTTTYGYDSVGNLTSVEDPLTNETLYEYDGLSNVTKVTDPRGKITYFYYAYAGCGGCGTGSGVLTKVTDPLGKHTYFAYDINGNRTKVTDALGRVTDYFYDDMNRLTKIESPSASGIYMTMAYDIQGQLTAQTDFEGKTTTYEYNFAGELTKQKDPDNNVYVENTYDEEGRLSTVKDGFDGTVDFDYDYDADGKLTRLTYANGKQTLYFYDTAGRMTKVGAGSSGTTDPTEYFFSTTTGLLSKVKYTAGAGYSEAFYYYDNAARLTKLTDWLSDDYTGNPGLRYGYDAAGRLTTLTDYDDEVLTYVYDAGGNVLTMTDYHSNSTVYTYTDRNQVSTITAPGSRVWDFDYNDIGQPTQYSHPNGMTTVYSYDTRNRMTKIEHKDGTTVLDSYLYALEDNGNITKTTHADGSYWDYYYDNRYRLTKAERFNSGATIKAKYEYTYSLADNMLTKVEPFLDDFNDGAYTGWSVWSGTWSAANNMAENTSAGAATLMRSNTDANYEASFRFRNNDTSNSNYFGYFWTRYVDGSNRSLVYITPAKVEIREQASGTWTTLDVDYTATSTQDTWYNFRIVCDGANIDVYRWEDGDMPTKVCETTSAQVTTCNYSGFATSASAQCDYDDIRIISDSLSNTTTMTYTNANEISTLTDPNGTTNFGFDDWGRMTSKSRGGYTATYTYGNGLADKHEEFDSDFPDENSVTATIGADMNLRDITNGSNRRFRYDAFKNLISEESEGDLVRVFTHSQPRNLVAVPLGHITGANPATGDLFTYHEDLISSVRTMRNQAKGEVGRFEFSPYGIIHSMGDTPEFGFAGMRAIGDSGLYDTLFRVHNSFAGRWMTRDPLGIVVGPNLFVYVGGNPIRYRDPLGLLQGGTPGTLSDWLCKLLGWIGFGCDDGDNPSIDNQLGNIVETGAEIIEEIVNAPGLPVPLEPVVEATTSPELMRCLFTFNQKSCDYQNLNDDIASDPARAPIPDGRVGRNRKCYR